MQGAAAESLANPSPSTCKWCPFKLICNVFWNAASPAWSGHLDGEAIEATVRQAPQALYSGLAYSLSVNVDAGTIGAAAATLAPIRKDSGMDLMNVEPGVRIRFVSLRVRHDQSLTTTMRTVQMLCDEVPLVVTNANHKDNSDGP
jgi:hypothetical protein